MKGTGDSQKQSFDDLHTDGRFGCGTQECPGSDSCLGSVTRAGAKKVEIILQTWFGEGTTEHVCMHACVRACTCAHAHTHLSSSSSSSLSHCQEPQEESKNTENSCESSKATQLKVVRGRNSTQLSSGGTGPSMNHMGMASVTMTARD